MRSLKSLFQNSSLRRLFRLSDERGRGRGCMMLSTLFTTAVGALSGGIFYSGFLLEYDIDLVNIGILSFIPLMASPFCLLSPLIFERFKKRKLILSLGRALYYTVNILLFTLIPALVGDPGSRVFWLCVTLFLSSAINNTLTSGYSVWHLNFIPDDEIRQDYFRVNQLLANFLSGAVTLVSSLIADAIPDGSARLGVIVTMRYIAYAVALLDVLTLSLPREYPYRQSGRRIGVIKTLTEPFRHKKFIGTMALMCAHSFISNLPLPFQNVYMLDSLRISYTTINLINASYFLFYIFFGALCNRYISHYSGFKVFAVACLLNAPTYVIYAFVQPGQLWLFVIMRLIQHTCGIFIALSYANFPYANLPEEDQTAYMSFYLIVANTAAFLSMASGTAFVKRMGSRTAEIFGVSLGSVQMLYLITFALTAVFCVILLFSYRRLTPDGWTPPPSMIKLRLLMRRRARAGARARRGAAL